MSLDFDVSAIKEYERVTVHPDDLNKTEGERRFNPVTEAIVWGLLEIGMGTITEKNWQEVYIRMNIADQVQGYGRMRTMKDGKIENRHVTPAEVRQHIGLRTNISTETETHFKNKMFTTMKREATGDLRRFLTEEDGIESQPQGVPA